MPSGKAETSSLRPRLHRRIDRRVGDAILDGFRWLTVGPKDQKDLNILLAYPAPPMFSPEDAAAIRALVAKGSLSGGVFETADCQKPFEELSAKGVTFLQEPAERPYGSMRSSETTPETGSASPSPSGSVAVSRRPSDRTETC